MYKTEVDNGQQKTITELNTNHPYTSMFDFFGLIVDFRSNTKDANVMTEDAYKAFLYRGDQKPHLTCFVRTDKQALSKREYKELMLEQTRFNYMYEGRIDFSNTRSRVFPPFAFEPLRQKYFELHAGSVSYDGRGIVLMGVSGRGKTTLTVALVRNGYKLLSEDITPIDMTDSSLECFPQAAGIRRETARIFPEMNEHIEEQSFFEDLDGKEVSQVDLRDVYGDCIGTRCQPGHVFFIERKHGSPVKLEKVRKGQAVVSLLSNAVAYYPKDLRRIIEALTNFVEKVDCYSLEYGESDEAVDGINSVVK